MNILFPHNRQQAREFDIGKLCEISWKQIFIGLE